MASLSPESEDPSVACRLFVYGTLAPGCSNEHILAELTGDWQPASTRGVLLPDGCAISDGFPALILDDPDAGEVEGLLFVSADLPTFWLDLDEFEGDGYRRVITTITTAAGERLKAYTYELNSFQRQKQER